MTNSAVELARRATQVQSPDDALRAVVELRQRLEELEELHVEEALRRGWSWARIATSLGVSKQAVHKKHAARLRRDAVGGDEARRRLLITGQARRAVAYAREEARGLGHESLASEHLLLGLMHESAGAASETLSSLGVSLARARRHVAQLLGSKEPLDSEKHVAVSARTRRAFEQSLREAVRLGSGHLGTEHLLLALLREREGRGPRVLGAIGLSAAAVEDRLSEVIAEARWTVQA